MNHKVKKMESNSITFFYIPDLLVTYYPHNCTNIVNLSNSWFDPLHITTYIQINIPGVIHNEEGPAVIDRNNKGYGALNSYYLNGRHLSYYIWKQLRSKLGKVFYG